MRNKDKVIVLPAEGERQAGPNHLVLLKPGHRYGI